jgi:hypothetical protein
VDNPKFQKITCINAENISYLKKDEIYFAIEYQYTYKVYSEPALKDKKDQSTLLGEYSKKRFFNLAKWRDEQIDSILKED